MSMMDLARQLEAGGAPDTILLDVRSPEEYAISHIAGAERFDNEMCDSELARQWSPEHRIVTYCSIGYRSSAAARRLASLGYQDVSNLEGSLFLWAGQGQRVECEGEVVERVHPYNRLWGCLLPRRLRARVRG